MMATICPFASWRPLPEATSQPPITPRVVIFHTMVGSLAGTERHFRDQTGIESHFGLGGPTDGPDLDGALWQWMDLGRQADANLNANDFAISIETSDGGDPDRPWSPKQLATLVRLGNWLADHFGIPRHQCPAWDRSGFGWHVMFGAPGPWTPVAKTCPGPVRIRQLREIVFPAIFAGRQLEEDDMPYTEAQLTEIAYQGALDGHRRAAGGTRDAQVSAWYERLEAKVDALEAKVDLAAISQQLATLQAAVDNLAAGGPPSGYHGTVELTPNP